MSRPRCSGVLRLSSNAVRDLAARVSNDHLGVRQAAFDLAARCQVTPVLVSSRLAAANEHGRTMANLLTLTGSEFDHAYVQHEVAFHRAAIDAVRNASFLPAATCPALKTHFKDVLPAFAKHLAETEALAGQLTAR